MAPCLGVHALATPAEPTLAAFLDLSATATGFGQLDAAVGRELLAALLAWEPALGNLLQGWRVGQSLRQLSSSQLALTDMVIEAWYTGAVPTATGTRVVSFAGALAWKCTGRTTAITFCRA